MGYGREARSAFGIINGERGYRLSPIAYRLSQNLTAGRQSCTDSRVDFRLFYVRKQETRRTGGEKGTGRRTAVRAGTGRKQGQGDPADHGRTGAPAGQGPEDSRG